MRSLTNSLAILVSGLVLGAMAYGQVANASGPSGPRFTPTVRQIVNSRSCPEDNFKVVTAIRPNPRFDGRDPLIVACISREGDGWVRAR